MFSFVLFGIFHTYLCAEDGCVFFTTGATIGAKTAYPSRVHEFTPVFSGFRVNRSLVLCVCFVDRCLSVCPLTIVLSVLLQYTILITPFAIFKLFLISYFFYYYDSLQNPNIIRKTKFSRVA